MINRVGRVGLALLVGATSAVVAVAAPAAAATTDATCALPTRASAGDDVAVWGDSLAYGKGAGKANWPAIVASFSDTDVFNGGSPGERIAGVAARQGGRPARLETDLFLPAGSSTPSEVVDFKNGTVFQHVEDPAYPVLNGLAGTFTDSTGNPPATYTGTIAWATAMDVDRANGDQVFVPTGTVPPPGVTLTAESKFRTQMGTAHKGEDQIIWAGHNDLNRFAPENSFNDVVPMICNMVVYGGVANHLVLGLSTGSLATQKSKDPTSFYARAIQSPPGSSDPSINEQLAAVYGDHYLDIRQALIDVYTTMIDWDDLPQDGRCTKTEDIDDINVRGLVPCSLRFGKAVTSADRDTVHMNPIGNCLVAREIAIKTDALNNATDRWFGGRLGPNDITVPYCLSLPVP